jgi:hypothetical protein
MKKTSLSLVLAGVFAVAGVAQAQSQTWDVPQKAGEASTMTMGQPNLETDNPGVPQTHVMGAAPSVHTTTTIYPSHTVVTTHPSHVYVHPQVQVSPDTVVTVPYSPMVVDRHQAAATFNVPARAGEASTMTGGAPNMVTNNDRVILQQSHLYSSVSPALIDY